MPVEKIYYEDQTNWSPADFRALWRFFDHLFGFIGPTEKLRQALADYDNLSDVDRRRVDRAAGHQARRTGKKDDELAALDLARMSDATRYLMKHMLIHQQRLDIAIERFPNLAPLRDVGPLGRTLVLEEEPSGSFPYYESVGIQL